MGDLIGFINRFMIQAASHLAGKGVPLRDRTKQKEDGASKPKDRPDCSGEVTAPLGAAGV